MIIFQYKVTPVRNNKDTFRIIITDNEKDNATTWFFGKKYVHTISKEDIAKIIKIIKDSPELFDIPAQLEPNDDILDGYIYSFVFSDGKRSNAFSGFNIRDYGRNPRKNATLALRVARRIKEEVLSDCGIRTMISSRLQNWPKYRKEYISIKI